MSEPHTVLPPAEVWYCWKQYAAVEGWEEQGKRLLTPHAAPGVYESQIDVLFETPAQAEHWLAIMVAEDGIDQEEADSFVLVELRMTPQPRQPCPPSKT